MKLEYKDGFLTATAENVEEVLLFARMKGDNKQVALEPRKKPQGTDEQTTECTYCHKVFTTFGFTRHHNKCRLRLKRLVAPTV